MHRGYIKIWRKIADSGLLQMPETLSVFMHILLNAAHRPMKLGSSAGVIDVNRGEYIGGRLSLSGRLKLSERQIRTSLDRLSKLEILTIRTTSKYSVYSIVNYELYQDSDQQTTSKTTNKRPANDQQTTTKQELKHLSIEKNNTMSPLPAKGDSKAERINGKAVAIDEVLKYLNLQARRNYRAKNPNGSYTANADIIAMRLKEGYTVDQLKDVIAAKSNQWMGDERMDQYLNPQTLFRKSNFTKYLAEAEC